MQFLVLAYDGKDEGAPARRLAVREKHLAKAEEMYRGGTLLYASAILDEGGKMTGSMLVVEFPSEAALREQWLDGEPYITGDVWREVTIQQAKVPGFIIPPTA